MERVRAHRVPYRCLWPVLSLTAPSHTYGGQAGLDNMVTTPWTRPL